MRGVVVRLGRQRRQDVDGKLVGVVFVVGRLGHVQSLVVLFAALPQRSPIAGHCRFVAVVDASVDVDLRKAAHLRFEHVLLIGRLRAVANGFCYLVQKAAVAMSAVEDGHVFPEMRQVEAASLSRAGRSQAGVANVIGVFLASIERFAVHGRQLGHVAHEDDALASERRHGSGRLLVLGIERLAHDFVEVSQEMCRKHAGFVDDEEFDVLVGNSVVLALFAVGVEMGACFGEVGARQSEHAVNGGSVEEAGGFAGGRSYLHLSVTHSLADVFQHFRFSAASFADQIQNLRVV